MAVNTWLRQAVVTVVATLSIAALGMLLYYRYLAERPLPPVDPAAEVEVTAPLTERAVLVVVDSLREDAALDPAIMPHFQALAARGATGINMTPEMTLTTMSVFTTATGMEPSISWSLKNFDAEPFADESALSILARSGRRIALLGDASWTQMFGGHAAKTLEFRDKGFFSLDDGGITPEDQQTMRTAEDVLADPSYAFVVIHLTSSDKAAHRYGSHLRNGADLSEYARSLNVYDAWLGRVIGKHSDATWLVMSDHGCTLRGNHGGGEAEARRAPFAWAGPGIRPGVSVEQSMTTLAPTLNALFGLRAPRTAEVSPSWTLLEHDAERRNALTTAQLSARRDFVRGYLDASAVTDALPAEHGDPDRRLADLEHATHAVDASFGWLRILGLALGLVAQLLLLSLIGLVVGWKRPWIAASGWAALSWALIIFDHWQFPSIQLFGELTNSPAGFVKRLLIIGLLAGVMTPIVRRYRDRPAAGWIAFCFFVLLLGQSAMRWPYGPLPEMYRAIMLFGLVGAALLTGERGRMLAAAGVLAALYAAVSFRLSDVLDARGHASALTIPTNLGLLGFLAILARAAGPTDRLTRGLWVAVFATALGAIAYRNSPSPWLVQSLILAVVAILAIGGWGADARLGLRNLVIAAALVLYRTLAVDGRVLILLGIAAAALIIADARVRDRAWAAPVIAAFAVLLHQSYFFEAGYRYSFSSLDMTVAFAATRDAIDLGEGFVFLLLQALGPWLIVAACALYNRTANFDYRGAHAVAVALVGAYVVQAWGAFASFEYEIDNHWFTMHAVPLIVFSLCGAMLAGVATGAAIPVTLRRS